MQTLQPKGGYGSGKGIQPHDVLKPEQSPAKNTKVELTDIIKANIQRLFDDYCKDSTNKLPSGFPNQANPKKKITFSTEVTWTSHAVCDILINYDWIAGKNKFDRRGGRFNVPVYTDESFAQFIPGIESNNTTGAGNKTPDSLASVFRVITHGWTPIVRTLVEPDWTAVINKIENGIKASLAYDDNVVKYDDRNFEITYSYITTNITIKTYSRNFESENITNTRDFDLENMTNLIKHINDHLKLRLNFPAITWKARYEIQHQRISALIDLL